jgi:hypothetical protein
MAGLGSITFYADDPQALARFWSGVFGHPCSEAQSTVAAATGRGMSSGTVGQSFHRRSRP